MKDILFIWRKFNINNNGESLDLLLTCLAANYNCDLLLLNEGVLNLLPIKYINRDITSNLKSLPLFGLNTIYADNLSINKHHIVDFNLPIILLNTKQVKDKINQFNNIITL